MVRLGSSRSMSARRFSIEASIGGGSGNARARPCGRALFFISRSYRHGDVLEPYIHRPVPLNCQVGCTAEGIDDLVGSGAVPDLDFGCARYRRPPARRARDLDRHRRIDVQGDEGHELIHEAELRFYLRYPTGALGHRLDRTGRHEAVDPSRGETLFDHRGAGWQPGLDDSVVAGGKRDEEACGEELDRAGHVTPIGRWGRMGGYFFVNDTPTT